MSFRSEFTSFSHAYLNATDPKLATRTWQDVMDNIITKKTDDTGNERMRGAMVSLWVFDEDVLLRW